MIKCCITIHHVVYSQWETAKVTV